MKYAVCLLPLLLTAAPAVGDTVPAFHKGSETLVVVPDTEGYARKRPQVLDAMMKWVAEQKTARSIKYVLHVGDITNDNLDVEWVNVRKAFSLIDGRVPYVLAAGNHDYDHTEGRLTHMNKYFKVDEQKKWPTFGGVYEKGKLENHYQFAELQGRKWIILSLEMGPRKEVIAWANKVLADHKEHLAIILTHGYLYYANSRYNHLLGGQRASPYNFYGDGADGEMLWNRLVRRHPNVMMVVCGHLSSQYVGYRKDEGDYGNTVHQMLVDYEKMRGGGMGFLRILEFLPDKKTVQVRTYSPVTKEVGSPITRGAKPMRDPKLENFTFTLAEATRDEPRPQLSAPTEPLRAPPIHRWSFNETANAVASDSIGKKHATLREGARFEKGRVVLGGKAMVALPKNVLNGLADASFEVWFAPTGDHYKWTNAVRFGNGDDWFAYYFRTRTCHRAEIAVNRHNQDIQRTVPIEKGKPMHVVVTYDHDGADGKPQLCYYRDGVNCGKMTVTLKLTDVENPGNRLGPIDAWFDELRLYDRALTAEEVTGSYNAGPDKLNLSSKARSR